MISNQILQSTIEGIKNISRVELCVTDVEGKVLVTTFPEVEISQNDIVTFAQSQADSQTMKNYQFFKVYDEHQLEYVLVVKGGNDDIHLIGKMVTFQIQGLLTATRSASIKTTLSRICCSTTCCWSTSTTGRRSYILKWKHAALYLFLRQIRIKTAGRWKASRVCSVPNPVTL